MYNGVRVVERGEVASAREGMSVGERLAYAEQILKSAAVAGMSRQGGPKPPGFGSHIDVSKMHTPEAHEKVKKVKAFNDFHHEIIRFLAVGMTKSDVVRLMGTSLPTINKVINSPMGKMLLAQLRMERDNSVIDIRKGLKELEAPAVNVLRDALTMEDVPWSTRSKVALSVIQDIGGYESPKRVQVAHAIMTPEFIERLKADAVRAGIDVRSAEGSVEPAEVVEVETQKPPFDINLYSGMRFV